jgi:beta-glucosidase
VGTRSFNLTVRLPINVSAGTIPIVVDYVHLTGEAVLYFSIGRQQRIDIPAIQAAAAASEAVIFVGGITAMLEGEEMDVYEDGFAGGDRTKIELPPVQRNVLAALKTTGKPLVFVLCAGSAIAFDPVGINAVVDAFYPGQAGGTAVADVLFGHYNPGGRLPITFYRKTEDLPAFGTYSMAGHTYRFFTGSPLYPFGHGLSYTRFAYEKLVVPANAAVNSTVAISFYLRNTGAKGGDEVVQVYVKAKRAGEPVKSLRCFQRKFLVKGATSNISVNLPAADFAVFNETSGPLELAAGEFAVCVGGSSADTALLCKDVTLSTGSAARQPSTAVVAAVTAVAGVVIIGIVIAVVACWKSTPKGAERL